MFNPYKQSFCEELTDILCRKRPRKYYDFTAYEADKLIDSTRKLSFKVMKRDKVIEKINYKRIDRIPSVKSTTIAYDINQTLRNDSLNSSGTLLFKTRLNDLVNE